MNTYNRFPSEHGMKTSQYLYSSVRQAMDAERMENNRSARLKYLERSGDSARDGRA